MPLTDFRTGGKMARDQTDAVISMLYGLRHNVLVMYGRNMPRFWVTELKSEYVMYIGVARNGFMIGGRDFSISTVNLFLLVLL